MPDHKRPLDPDEINATLAACVEALCWHTPRVTTRDQSDSTLVLAEVSEDDLGLFKQRDGEAILHSLAQLLGGRAVPRRNYRFAVQESGPVHALDPGRPRSMALGRFPGSPFRREPTKDLEPEDEGRRAERASELAARCVELGEASRQAAARAAAARRASKSAKDRKDRKEKDEPDWASLDEKQVLEHALRLAKREIAEEAVRAAEEEERRARARLERAVEALQAHLRAALLALS
jgi:hypothetical protein